LKLVSGNLEQLGFLDDLGRCRARPTRDDGHLSEEVTGTEGRHNPLAAVRLFENANLTGANDIH
jgi:hypothetical protein